MPMILGRQRNELITTFLDQTQLNVLCFEVCFA